MSNIHTSYKLDQLMIIADIAIKNFNISKAHFIDTSKKDNYDTSTSIQYRNFHLSPEPKLCNPLYRNSYFGSYTLILESLDNTITYTWDANRIINLEINTKYTRTKTILQPNIDLIHLLPYEDNTFRCKLAVLNKEMLDIYT